MKVRIRAAARYNKCPDCGLIFNLKNDFTCLAHNRYPKWVYIEISEKKSGERTCIHSWRGQRLVFENAISLVAKIRQEEEDGLFALKNYLESESERLKFSSYSQEYLKHIESRVKLEEYGLRTYVNVKSIFQTHLIPNFSNVDLRDITKGMVRRWADNSSSSPKMKNKAMKVLREMLNWARDNQDLLSGSFNMPFLTENHEMVPAIEIDKQRLVVSRVDTCHQPIIEFLMSTGHRPSVVRALQFQDIDFENDIYTTKRRWDHTRLREGLKPKGQAEARYPLGEVKAIIQRALQGRIVGPETFVFMWEEQSTKQWHHYTKDYLFKIYNKAREKAGLPREVTLYAFSRHSMASQLSQAGASDDQIAMVLNNTPRVVQRHYKNVFPKTISNILKLRDKPDLFPVVSQAKSDKTKG